MAYQDWMAAAITAASAIYIARVAWRSMRAGSGGACGCDQKQCPATKNGAVVDIQLRPPT